SFSFRRRVGRRHWKKLNVTTLERCGYALLLLSSFSKVINLWPLNVEGVLYNYIVCRQSITFRNFMMNKDRKAVCSNLLRFYLIFKNIFVTLDDCGCVNEQIFGVKGSCEQFNVSFHRNSKLNPGLVSLPNGDRIFLGPKNRNYR